MGSKLTRNINTYKMKKIATIILLFVAIAISFSACNNNEPSNASDEKLSHEDSLVLAYKKYNII